MSDIWSTALSTQVEAGREFRSTPEILLLHKIILAVSRAPTFETALEKVLQLVCTSTEWTFGEVWLPSRDRTSLHHSGIWYAAQPEANLFSQVNDYTFQLGEGLPGRVWQSCQSEWIPDVSCLSEPVFKRSGRALAAGLRAALGVPVQAGEHVLAVLVLFMDRAAPQKPSQIALVTTIAKHLGGILRLKQTEAALVESQGRLQRLIDALPGIVFRGDRDPQWSMLYLSNGCHAITGYHSEELTQGDCPITYNDITHPEDLPQVLMTIQTAIQQQRPYVVEYRIHTRSGQEKWLWEKGAGVFDTAQQLLGIEGFITDITDLKTAERALKDREDFLQLILNSIPQHIFWKDRNSVYLGCNEAFAKAMGVDCPADIVGKTDYDFPQIALEEAEYYRSRDQLVIKRGEADMHVLEPQAFADGSHTWTDCNKIPIRNDREAVIGVLCTFEDVTERIAAAQALARRENYLAALVEIQGRLLSLDITQTQDWMTPILETLGRVSEASRVYHYKMHEPEPGLLLASQQAEWTAAGIPPTLGEALFQGIPVQQLFPDWLEALTHQNPINLTWDQFNEVQRQILSEPPSSAKSLLLLPLIVKGKFVGIIGFSNCLTADLWEQSEIDLLRIATAAISLAIERQQAEQSLKQAEAKYRSIFENSVEGIFQSTAEGHYTTVNPMLARLYGYDSPEDLIKNLTDISQQLYVDPSRRQQFIRQMAVEGAVLGFESQVYRKDGSIIWISESARAIYNSQGALVGYEGTVEDVTQRKQGEAEILSRDRLLQGVAEASRHLLTSIRFEAAMPEVMATLGEAANVDRVYLYENHAHATTGALAMSLRYEWTQPGVISGLHQPHWQNLLYSAYGLERWHDSFVLGQSISGIVRTFPAQEQALLQRDGILSLLMVPIFVDEHLWGYIGFDDCSRERCWSANEESILVAIAVSLGGAIKRQQTEEKMRYQAFHDPLTGLPNRVLFNHQLPLAIAHARRASETLGVFFLDLDRFKTINDTLGHAVGDQLLQQVTQRLTEALREQDIIARWGGDEFTLILPALASSEAAARVAQRLSNALKPVFQLDGHELHISSSIGIALFPQDGEDMTTLLQNADAAMYRAKEQGRNNYQFYTNTLNSEASQRLTLENSLHHALERQEFVIHYQPQINVDTGQVIQVEALLRWQHRELGLISPQTFIPLAEETGLIVPIGEWVLREVCVQSQQWQQAGQADLRIAVNLSARQLQHPDLVPTITSILCETGLPPSALELEITETAAMRDVEATICTLQELCNLGVRISMDDFGTGYSSLSYLKKFPLHGLKIDRAFVRDVATNPQDRAMVTAIIAMARGLNLNVVAEGVETAAQVTCLRQMGCTEMQGFLFSHPLDAKAMLTYLGPAVTEEEPSFLD